MNEYISREDALKKAKSSISVPADNEWDCGYNTAMAEMQGFIKQLPSADVISRKEVLELIESFKVESTHELSKSDFDRNDTLRLLQDVIKGVTWEDVL